MRSMVCDTAIASLLAGNHPTYSPIHAFVLGADRIASNGDTANKISSYQISLLAHNVPPPSGKQRALVLVAAPVATMDLSMDDGSKIVIEERPSWEACTVRGKIYDHAKDAPATSEATKLSAEQSAPEADVVTVLVTPKGAQAWNPAFDVVPARLVDGIVSELGVAEKEAGSDGFGLREWVKQGLDAKAATKASEWKEADREGGANAVKVQQ